MSGVVTQGSGPKLGYLTKYRLAYALQSGVFTDFTEDGKPGSPAQVRARLMCFVQSITASKYLTAVVPH